MGYIFNYVTTNNINSKRYVGKHATENLDDGYLGGGTMLRAAIKKHGRKNFTRKILLFCDSEREAMLNERKIIELLDTLAPRGYNLSPVGGAANDGHIPWNKGKTNVYTKETIQKIREARLKQVFTEESYAKLRAAAEKRRGVKMPPEVVKKIADKRRGMPMSDSWHEKLMATHTTDEFRKKMSGIAKARPPRKLPEEHKANIRKAMQTPEARQNMSNIKKGRTQEEKHSTFLKGIATRIKNGSIMPGEIERDRKGKFKKKAA